MKRVSIRDIAKQAGVVPSTVSFVLNGKAKQMRISDKVAERIKALAEATGYSPHHTAVSLRTGRSNIIGLIVEDISNVFFGFLAKIIEEEAYALGYKIVYCSTENDDLKGSELIRMLSRQQVDGFLITPSTGMRKEIERLVESRKPVVLMDRYFDDSLIPYILVDNYKGVRIGMDFLLGKGYKKIAFVTVDLDQVQMLQREQAYKDALLESGLEADDILILKLEYSARREDSVQRVSQFLNDNSELDAVFFATNYVGIYGLEAIRRSALSIPDDVAVICFDDHDIFKLFSPSITIIEQPIESIARAAVQLLIKQLENTQKPDDELQVQLSPQLIVRSSA